MYKRQRVIRSSILTVIDQDYIESAIASGARDSYIIVKHILPNAMEMCIRDREARLKFFRETTGTTVSDDGVPHFTWADYTDGEIAGIFEKARKNEPVSAHEVDQYQSAFLYEMGRRYSRNNYVMQLHIGTYLDANRDGVRRTGHSTGFDCTDDQCSVTSVGELLNRLKMCIRDSKWSEACESVYSSYDADSQAIIEKIRNAEY